MSRVKILAIETSTEACSAALWLDGTLSFRSRIAPREHAKLIIPMLQALLDEADINLSELDAIAFGRGPGAFTGVRIAAGVAQGAAFAADVPVIAVSSLAALAQQGLDKGFTAAVAAIDARMSEIYCATFGVDDQGLAVPLTQERVCPPNALEFPAMQQRCIGVGSGFASYTKDITQAIGSALQHIEPISYPDAQSLIRLAVRDYQAGIMLPPEQALPVYLRDRVAQPASAAKS